MPAAAAPSWAGVYACCYHVMGILLSCDGQEYACCYHVMGMLLSCDGQEYACCCHVMGMLLSCDGQEYACCCHVMGMLLSCDGRWQAVGDPIHIYDTTTIFTPVHVQVCTYTMYMVTYM